MTEFTKDLPEEKYKPVEDEIIGEDVRRVKLPEDNPDIFEETQRMDQAWIWILLGIATLATIIPLVLTSQPLWIFFIISVVMVMALSMISAMKLYTRIDDVGVHFRMMPFHLKEKTIAWEDIDSIRVRQYSPIGEYGGYGIRIGGNGSAYNIRGNQGIQIVKKNGKRILIGTQKNADAIRQLERRPLIV